MEEEDDSKVYSSDSQMNMKHSNCVVYTSLYQKVDIKNYLLYNNMKYRLLKCRLPIPKFMGTTV